MNRLWSLGLLVLAIGFAARPLIEATVRGGKIESLRVEPKSRLEDVAVVQPDGGVRKWTAL